MTLPIPNVEAQGPREGGSLLQHLLGSQHTGWLQCPALQVQLELSPSLALHGRDQHQAELRLLGKEGRGTQVGRAEAVLRG